MPQGGNQVLGFVAQLVDRASMPLARLGMAYDRFHAKTGKLGMALQKNQQMFMGIGVAAGVGAFAMNKLTGSALQTAEDFEKSFAKVAFSARLMTKAGREAAGATKEMVESFAMKTGIRTIFDPKEVSDALYELTSAGIQAKKAMDMTEPILNISAMSQGMLDLGQSSKLSISIMNKYSKSAKDMGQVSDVLARSLQETLFHIEDFPEFFNALGAAPLKMKLSIEETLALGDAMKKVGQQSAQAGHTIAGFSRVMFRGMQTLFQWRKIEGMRTPKGRKASRLFISLFGSKAEFEKAMFDVNGKLKAMREILPSLQKRMRAMPDRGKAWAKTMSLMNEQVSNFMVGISSKKTGNLEDMFKRLENSKGATEEFLKAIKGTMDYLKRLWRGTKQVFLIMIAKGIEPLVKALYKGVTAFTNLFLVISDRFPILGKVVGIFVAFAGVVLTAVAAVSLLIAVFGRSLSAMFNFFKGLATNTVGANAYTASMTGATAATNAFNAAQRRGSAQLMLPAPGQSVSGGLARNLPIVRPAAVKRVGIFRRMLNLLGKVAKKVLGVFKKLGKLIVKNGKALGKFAAVIGIVVGLFTLWKKNVWGVRDALTSFWDFIKAKIIKPLVYWFTFVKVLLSALFTDSAKASDVQIIKDRIGTIINILNSPLVRAIRKVIVFFRKFFKYASSAENWKNLINGLKALTLIGAGIGMLIGGPQGAAIGLAVGIIAAVIISIVKNWALWKKDVLKVISMFKKWAQNNPLIAFLTSAIGLMADLVKLGVMWLAKHVVILITELAKLAQVGKVLAKVLVFKGLAKMRSVLDAITGFDYQGFISGIPLIGPALVKAYNFVAPYAKKIKDLMFTIGIEIRDFFMSIPNLVSDLFATLMSKLYSWAGDIQKWRTYLPGQSQAKKDELLASSRFFKMRSAVTLGEKDMNRPLLSALRNALFSETKGKKGSTLVVQADLSGLTNVTEDQLAEAISRILESKGIVQYNKIEVEGLRSEGYGVAGEN